ncbi:MAG: glycosyltransferase, partial [Candidatus Brocadiae bacterium]|nr:glycosyltransferase [Candidatus Brocadiia bacterium]
MALQVIHVVRALQTGGLETLVLDVCARMRREGVDAGICALLPGDGLAERPEYAGVPCDVLRPRERRHRPAAVRALKLHFLAARPDVVHVHNFLAQSRAGLAARLARVPVLVGTKHGVAWPRVAGSRRLAGFVYRLADAMIAVSEDVRSGFLAHFRFPPDRMRVILNGIDTDRFRPPDAPAEDAVRRQVLGVTGAPLLGTVCRLIGYKGVPTLLEAFRVVHERLPGAVLVLAGDGPERRAYKRQAEGLGIAHSVHFLGNRSDVAAIYPLLDIYVQASHTEGISLTMLEAASCALPIVATNVGGNPEIVVDGKTGRL